MLLSKRILFSSSSLVAILIFAVLVATISQNDIAKGQGSDAENKIVEMLVKKHQDYVDKGESLYDQGQYEEAITYYDKALNLYPLDDY